MYQATRMFVSNLNARLAQRFMALVLLPHIRQDIQQHKRLHFALFQAVKKAAFKPDAFFKVAGPTYLALQILNNRHQEILLPPGLSQHFV